MSCGEFNVCVPPISGVNLILDTLQFRHQHSGFAAAVCDHSDGAVSSPLFLFMSIPGEPCRRSSGSC
jgi:hypothetical protein